MSKIPLKTRKSIKEALGKAEAHAKKASAAFGKELTFEDNTSELFEKLQADGKGEDWLFELGTRLTEYIEQFSKSIVDFCKDNSNKEQLEAELTTGKFGVMITDSDTNEYWRIENGTLWMLTTCSYFGSYLNYFDVERLAKILGKADSMPLNTRKSLSNAAKDITKCVQNASKAFGKELTFVDNYQEIYDELKTSGKSEDYLWTIGDPLKEYTQQMEKTIVEFCKNAENKEQLETELTTGKIGVKIGSDSDKYWFLEDGILWMYTQPSYFGSYLNYFDVERLCGILGKNDALPLNARKNLKANIVKVNKSCASVSKLFGKELAWVDNFQEIYDKLKSSGKSQDYLWTFGDQLSEYAQQVVTAFTVFCKDSDNKEALEEVLTSGKIGVRICDDSANEEYWVIEDGTLWMETKASYYGSYLNYFDSERLEKKL